MPSFKRVLPRTMALDKTTKSPRPPIEICALPEIFYVLSHIQLKMSFIRFFKSFSSVKQTSIFIQNLSLTWVLESIAIASAAFIFWLYRKPPDKFIYFESIVIQIKSRRQRALRAILRLFFGAVMLFLFSCSPCPFPHESSKGTDLSKADHLDDVEKVDTRHDRINLSE